MKQTFWPRYPGDASFGYDLRLHAFTLHGRVLGPDEVERVAAQKAAEHHARKAAHQVQRPSSLLHPRERKH